MKHIMRFITGLVAIPFMVVLIVLLVALAVILGPPIAILLWIYNIGEEVWG